MKSGTVCRGGCAKESMSMPMPLSIMRCFVMPESVESTSTTPADGEIITMELPVRVRSRSM